MTLEEIEQRLDTLENMIAAERDTQRLAALNRCFQLLLDKLVALDLEE